MRQEYDMKNFGLSLFRIKLNKTRGPLVTDLPNLKAQFNVCNYVLNTEPGKSSIKEYMALLFSIFLFINLQTLKNKINL